MHARIHQSLHVRCIVSHIVSKFFHNYLCVFIRQMELEGSLDPDNEIHLYALHLVFVPLIQKSLDEFSYSWNHHGLRTERGSPSPIRLFIRGMAVFHRIATKYNVSFTEIEQVFVYRILSEILLVITMLLYLNVECRSGSRFGEGGSRRKCRRCSGDRHSFRWWSRRSTEEAIWQHFVKTISLQKKISKSCPFDWTTFGWINVFS